MIIQFLERQPWKYLLGAIALLTFLVYARWIPSPFVSLDDGLLITKNPATQMISGWSLKRIFTTYDPELYIPLTYLSWQITHAIAGLHGWAYHLGNLILHVGSALLITQIVTILFRKKSVGFLTGLLFAIHPVNVEAVMWAAARKDTLSGFFFFLSLLLYLRYHTESSRKNYWWSVTTFSLALLAKASVITLPLVLILVDWFRARNKNSLVHYASFFALSVVFGIIAVIGKSQVIERSDLKTTILLALKSTTFYLWKLIWPTGLTVIYPQTTPVTITSPEFLIPAIVVTAIGVFICATVIVAPRIRHPSISSIPSIASISSATFCLAFYLLTLAPNYLNFIKNGFLFFASDRYAYIPSMGILTLISLTAIHGAERIRSARALRAGGALAAIVLTMLVGTTFVQAGSWRSSIAMYRRVLALYPDSAMAENNLGNDISQAGDPEAALPHFERAIALMPAMISAHLNMGNYFRAHGEFPKALAAYERAVALTAVKARPNHEELASYYIYGETLEQVGRLEDSLRQFTIAAEKGPRFAETHFNLGLQYQKRHRDSEAIGEFARAVELEPLFVPALYHLAGVQAETGHLDEAIATLERLIRIDPHYEKAQEHLKNMKTMQR